MKVLYFGPIKDITGKDSDEYHIGAGSTLENVLDWVTDQYKEVAELLPSCALSVNEEYVLDRELMLGDNDEVALIPPVSGG